MKRVLVTIGIIVMLFTLEQTDPVSTSDIENLIVRMLSMESQAWAESSMTQPAAVAARTSPTDAAGRVILGKPVIHDPKPGPRYVIGQSDVLEIVVWRSEQLSRSVTVRPDGMISLPLIQDIVAEGLTADELRMKIWRHYKNHIENPKITVIVSQINSYNVCVIGNVVRPEVYPITGKTTIMEVISKAGGFTEYAKKHRIRVISGKGTKTKVNYNKIISGRDSSQNVILQRGDTVVVP